MKRLSDSSRLENQNKAAYSSWVNSSKPHALHREVTRNPARLGQQKRYPADDLCLNAIAAPRQKIEGKNVYSAPCFASCPSEKGYLALGKFDTAPAYPC